MARSRLTPNSHKQLQHRPRSSPKTEYLPPSRDSNPGPLTCFPEWWRPEMNNRWRGAKWSNSAGSWRSAKLDGACVASRQRHARLSTRPVGRSNPRRLVPPHPTSHRPEVPTPVTRPKRLVRVPILRPTAPGPILPTLLLQPVISSTQSWNRWQPNSDGRRNLTKKTFHSDRIFWTWNCFACVSST